MIAEDVIDRVAQVIGSCNEATVFEYLSDAVEILANKATWDPLACYLDIQTTGGNEVVLPDFVDDVLKVNINRKPAFSRGRLFEFRQNTDGTVIGDELGFTWADRGDRPVQVVHSEPVQLRASAADAIRAYGRDSEDKEIYHTDGTQGYPVGTALAGPNFKIVTGIKKYKTTNYVNLFAGSAEIGTYEPRDYEPAFRIIKVSQSTAAVRLLVQRRTYMISSRYDWIPISSRVAIASMVKSLFLARKQSDIKEVMYYERQAVQLLQEEQDSHNAHSKMSDETEVITVRNQSYETSECTTVSDIYDQASDIFGNIGRSKLLDRISDSIGILVNEANWDGVMAWLDLEPATDDHMEFTLPTWVEKVEKVNIGGFPTTPYNKWFEFHRNGPGQRPYQSYSFQDRGGYATVKDITALASLVAQVDTALDNNCQVRVFGYNENNEEIMVDGEKGCVIPAINGSFVPDPDLPKFKIITRIQKDVSIGFVRVFAFEDGATQEKLVGQFRPEETCNTYRRIRLGILSQNGIRCMVRKKTYRVSGLADVVPLCDRNALCMGMRCKAEMDKGNLESAVNFKKMAIDLLEAEQEAKNPHIAPSVEIDPLMAPGSLMLVQ